MHDLVAAVHGGFNAAALTPGLVGITMAVVLIAALLRGFTGFGFALAAVPLLGMFMTPAQAVPIALVLQLLGGLNELRRASRECHWPSLRWLIVGATIGSPIGALVLNVASAPVARIIIAVITAGAVWLLGRGFSLAAVPSRLVTVTVGLIAGAFNGLAAMPGPPAVVYYMSGPFGRVAARASLLVFFLATSIAALASVAMFGLLDPRVFWLSVLALPVMLVGNWVGEYGFRRSTDALHRKVSIVSLGVIALGSAVKGFSELI